MFHYSFLLCIAILSLTFVLLGAIIKKIKLSEVITMLKELLAEYKLPSLPEENTREKCLEIMQKNEFGYMPKAPESLSWEILDDKDTSFGGGKATPTTVRLFGKANGRDFSFPIRVCVPNDNVKHPFFIHANFRPNIPDKYQPTEEIIDNGFAVLSFCYTEVTSDDGDFSNGLAKTFYPDGVRHNSTDAGKIALWSWAAMRVMDYAEMALADKLDFENSAVTGHSRLGKTALLTGAYDERFKFVFSNCAGCAGDALERNKSILYGVPGGRSETIADITGRFPYWFCENYKAYAGNSEAMPFDQHFLTACIAPRNLYLVSAELDFWADQRNQFMNAFAVSELYEKMGVRGLVCYDRLPLCNEYYPEGNVGYHIRTGLHSQNRTDWLYYMDYFKRHKR